MYKLLIVDDEPSTRKGLRDYVNWSRFGITVCAVADDGVTGLQMADELKPDIVLTDVKMPTMDGIQLSVELRRRLPQVKIVFISGHNDIEYVKSALQVSAIDYILKPVNFSELDKVMEKVVGLIQEDSRQTDMMISMNAKLIQSMPLLKEKFLISLIRDGASNTSLLSEKLNMLEIPLSVEGRYLVAVISIDDDHADKLSSMAEREKQLRSFAVLNICQELIMRHLDGVAFENRNGEFICLLRLASEELDDQLYAIFTEMKQTLKTLLKISVTVGVGQTVHSLGQLPVSYQAASQASSLKLFLGKNQIITVDSLDSSSTHSFKLTGSILEKCASLLKAGDDTLVEQFVRELFAQLTGYRTASLRYCQNVCMQLILTGSGLLFELDMHNEEWANRELAVSEQLLHLETIDDLQSVTIDYFTKLSEGIRSKRDKQSNVVVERVKQYIEQNYHEDITINGIAKHVYLTSTYVCLLFKQETGETIKDYVTTFRMEKAKELLTDLQYKLYTISTAVGYNDSSYFSKIFKKHTGLTPSEYRGKSQ